MCSPATVGSGVNVGDCLEMSVLPAASVQRLIGRPPCGLKQMSAQTLEPLRHFGVFDTTYVGKIRARL